MTRLGSPRRMGMQSLRNAWLRLSVALMLVMFTATTAWALSGSGTSANPYVINTVNDWNTAATTQQYYDNGSNYVYIKLGADLNFRGKTFNIYGLSAYGLATARMIHFDGQGHTISGVTISKSGSAEIAALFGGLSAGGSISHLTVANSSFQAYKYVAGIVADNGGTVSDCHVASTVTLKVGYSHCGGIVASNYTPNSSTGGTVTGCTVGACMDLPSRTMNKMAFGGIVGDQNSAGTISNCLFNGTVTVYDGTSTLFGCITDYKYGTITGNCYCPIGTYDAFGEGSDTDGTAAVSVVSGIPDGATVSSAATYTYGGSTYCAQNAATTITAATNTAFKTFSVSGATSSSVTDDKKSATVNLGTQDVTITATLQTIGGSCGTNATWTLAQDDSKNYTRLTISGTGPMDDCEYKTVSNLWRTAADWGYDLTSVTVGDGITRIGEFAFIGCQSLASVTIPASVTDISDDAFAGCTSLESIEIPASVTTIGAQAFGSCISLASVTIYAPELSLYGWQAFENNASGRKIYVFNDCLDTYKAQASEMGVAANNILPIESIVRRGDANADGSISVTDIAVVVNCILQLDNNGGFSEYGADANGDGQVTVTDIGVIVDKILGSPTPAPPEGGEPQ